MLLGIVSSDRTEKRMGKECCDIERETSDVNSTLVMFDYNNGLVN